MHVDVTRPWRGYGDIFGPWPLLVAREIWYYLNGIGIFCASFRELLPSQASLWGFSGGCLGMFSCLGMVWGKITSAWELSENCPKPSGNCLGTALEKCAAGGGCLGIVFPCQNPCSPSRMLMSEVTPKKQRTNSIRTRSPDSA